MSVPFLAAVTKLVNNNGTLIAQICHIEAAEKGGERYNENQNDEGRRAFDNLMVMCYQHHVETNDVNVYTVVKLKGIKANHEAKFTDNSYDLPIGMEHIIVQDIQKQLDKINGIVVENQVLIKQGNQTSKENQESLAKIEEMVRSLQQGNVLKVDESSIHAEQFEFIKQLRNEKKAGTALSALLQFKKNNWTKINNEIKFKVIANIASILFELGRQKEAAKYLLELRDVEYENGETQAYIALAYSILNDDVNFEKSFATAVKINNKSINLWVAYIYSRGENVLVQDILKEIPEDIRGKAEILFSLGEAYLKRGLENEGI